MANGGHTTASSQRGKDAEPQPAPVPPPSDTAAPNRRDLASWWRQFKRGNAKREDEKSQAPLTQGIFGVPLQTSIRYANVAISLYDADGKSYIYGYVPIVVAKCGVFLKEKATDVEGIFRLSGSEKRIKELRTAFDSPDRYGKGLDWTGYTVHDAANILRRYFNQLPEPIIPLDFYERFRDPLRHHQAQAVGAMDLQAEDKGGFVVEDAIKTYQKLITELPPLNRQLLLYILDLLAVFASKSDLNKMTTANLSAIFQPGILSHPTHDMAPSEYRLSQDVLIFLIENQDHFLIGMQGTAADEKTVQEVQSGPPTPQAKSSTTSGAVNTSIGRSDSNSSAGAEGVRKVGLVRRNVSVSSKNSKTSPSPVTPSFVSPYTASSPTTSIYRSNTVPSKKSPALQSGRFGREKQATPSTPTSAPSVQPQVLNASESPRPTTFQATPVSSFQQNQPPPSGESTPLAVPTNASSGQGYLFPTTSESSSNYPPDPAPVNEESAVAGDRETVASTQITANTPPRSFTAMFSKQGAGEGDKKDAKRPQKLQKKRGTEGANGSARSSTHSLHGQHSPYEGPATPVPAVPVDFAKDQSPQAKAYMTPQQQVSNPNLIPGVSPSTSFKSHSSATDWTDNDPAEEAEKKPEKKRRWRFSHHNHQSPDKALSTSPPANVGSSSGAGKSVGSILSTGGAGNAGTPRKSLSAERPPPAPESLATDTPFTGGDTPSGITTTEISGPVKSEATGEPEKKGPLGWIRGKLQDRKDRDAEKQRAKSPPGGKSEGRTTSTASLQQPQQAEVTPAPSTERAKSMDVPRGPGPGTEQGSESREAVP